MARSALQMKGTVSVATDEAPIAKDFTIYVRRKGSDKEPWGERYQKETANPERWGRDLIDWFNRTRADPQQAEREFVRVEIHGDVVPPEHKWTKTSLTTVVHAGRMFDRMQCERCGITGKRFKLDTIKRDSKFRAAVYKQCDTATAHLKKQPLAAGKQT